MTDNRIFRTRSLGIPATGVRDQYADGVAAHLWELYIGDKSERTNIYKQFIINQLKKNNCHNVLDVACGTGVDSIMLLEEGFQLTSVDLSDKMLKHALATRWQRRKEPQFDDWEIEQGDWLTLLDDIPDHGPYDAVICLGNSFAHLGDEENTHAKHRIALNNFAQMVKPGGILIIDHRNYDYILEHGSAPTHNIYYNSKHVDSIKTSVVYVEQHPILVTLDYNMRMDDDDEFNVSHETCDKCKSLTLKAAPKRQFRLSYYPHRVKDFTNLLQEIFGERASQSVYGDFKPLNIIADPAFYIHVVQKPHD